jgi:hypothetical protein
VISLFRQHDRPDSPNISTLRSNAFHLLSVCRGFLFMLPQVLELHPDYPSDETLEDFRGRFRSLSCLFEISLSIL